MTILTAAVSEKDQPICDVREAVARYVAYGRIGAANVLPQAAR